MQPNLPRFVELQFSRFNDQAVNLLVIARRAAGLEVWVHPDWPQRFESEAERHGPAADAAGLAIARAWVRTI